MTDPDRSMFPWDPRSDAVLEAAANLDPNNTTLEAECVREAAGSIADHRANHDWDRR